MSLLSRDEGDPPTTYRLHIGALRTETGEAKLAEIERWFADRGLALVASNSNETFHHFDHVFTDPNSAFEYRMTWM